MYKIYNNYNAGINNYINLQKENNKVLCLYFGLLPNAKLQSLNILLEKTKILINYILFIIQLHLCRQILPINRSTKQISLVYLYIYTNKMIFLENIKVFSHTLFLLQIYFSRSLTPLFQYQFLVLQKHFCQHFTNLK